MTSSSFAQRGGFFLGLIAGLVVGIGLALMVAIYITKVPVPFVDKVPHRTQEQDAQEQNRNQRWDMNAPLGTKPAQVVTVAPAASAPASAPLAAKEAQVAGAASAPKAVSVSTKASEEGQSASPDAGMKFMVQAGAFQSQADADQQKANLAMLGFESRVLEREQNGRTVWRVRLGPFNAREGAEQQKARLQDAGIDANVVMYKP